MSSACLNKVGTSFTSRNLVLLLVSLFLLNGCNKEEDIPLAKVETLHVKSDGKNLLLNGNLLSLGTAKAEELGFVIDREQSPDLNNHESIALFRNAISPGSFSVSVVNDFEENQEYYIRSFYRNSRETVYGEQVSFINEKEVPLKMESFMPKQGVEGEYVKLFGSGFGANKDGVKVLFGRKEAKIASLMEERIIVKVPSYEFSGHCKITIKKNGHSIVYEQDSFQLIGPYVHGFTPEKGLGKVKITIEGSNFSKVPWENVVMVGDKQAEVFEASQNSILAFVNTNSFKRGKYPITVQSQGIKTVSVDSFEVLNPWTKVNSIPTGLRFSTVFKIQNRIFLCTGNTSEEKKDAVFEYNTETDQWVRKGSFPGGERVGAVGFSIKGKGYLATGSTSLHHGKKKSDLWEYDPAVDQWTQKSSLPGGARMDAIAFSYKGKGYVGLGTMETGWWKRQDFWEYDPEADQWRQLPDFEGNGRIGAFTSVIGNKFYVIGGWDPNTSFDSDIWEFDLESEKWTYVGVLDFDPVAFFSYEDKCYLIHESFEELHLVEFDPAKNRTMEELAVFPGEKRLSGTFSISANGALYFGGGNSIERSKLLSDVWKYPLITNQ